MRTAEEIYRDKSRMASLAYYYANREKCLERARAYYQKNKQWILEQRKKPKGDE